MGVRGWLGRLIRSSEQSDEDVRDELRFHLEERAEELMSAGVPSGEARRRAAAEFGDVERVETETRRVARQRVARRRWSDRLGAVLQDVSYAARLVRRSPGFAVAAVLTLGLGIGATTAVFTVVDSVLIRPLPYPDADRLVTVWETQPSQGRYREPTSPPNFLDLRAGASTLGPFAAWQWVSATVRTPDGAEVVDAAGVSGEFFEVMGVPARHGRTLGPTDDGSAVVISHGYAQRRFGSAPAAIGRTVELERGPAQIVGVMPAGYAAPADATDLWYRFPVETRTDHRASRYLSMVARLDAGVTREAAEAELQTVAARLGREYPSTNQGWSVRLVPARDEVVGSAGDLLGVLMGAVGVLLLLATVNVSNMLLGRAAARDGEMALRSALGASGSRIRGQLLVESGLLGVVAGVLGVVLAHLGVRALLALEPEAIPRATEVAIEYRVLGFAALVSIGVAVLMGLAPGRSAGRVAPGVALGRRGGSAGGSERLRRGLVVAELALSVVLLTGAGLLFRSFIQLRSLDPGYATADVLAAKVDLDTARYPDAPPRITYFQTLLDRAREVPGVVAAGVTSTMPLDASGIDFALGYSHPGDPPRPEAELPEVGYRIVSPDYVEAMGIRLVRGRDIERADRAGGRPVVLINRAFADILWPGEDAVGRRVKVHYIADGGVEWEVVGLVENTRHAGLANPPEPQVFVPMTQAEWLFDYMTLVVRHEGDEAGVVAGLRDAALSLDPLEPLFELQSIQALRSADVARERLAAAILGFFGLLALILSVVGVYGVVAYQVARRTRELGVRMALGASRSSVLTMVVGETAALAALGLLIGLVVTAAASRSVAGLLHGVPPIDPATYAAGGTLLFTAALLAAALPARHAARLDPIRALRAD